jgi:hypothetical protein
MRPMMNYLSTSTARTDALFVSALQRSDLPTATQVMGAVTSAVRQFGRPGCAERVAQEFGDHPEIAAPRMRWARRVIDEAFDGPEQQQTQPAATRSGSVASAGRAA